MIHANSPQRIDRRILEIHSAPYRKSSLVSCLLRKALHIGIVTSPRIRDRIYRSAQRLFELSARLRELVARVKRRNLRQTLMSSRVGLELEPLRLKLSNVTV